MRRLITITIAAVIAALACTAASAGDTAVKVYVNSKLTKLNPPAIIREGTTYVSLRACASSLGGTTRWIDKTKTAIVTVGNKRTKVPQSRGITINGVLYLPLRSTGQAVGCAVEWDRSRRAVKITSEAAPPTCYG